MAPSEGLREAGRELLRDILSERQLALFRVLARDARRFPELGRRYREEILGNRVRLFVRHVKGWPAELRAKVGDPERAARLFASLVRADVFETALLGGPVLDEADQRTTACRAAADLLALVDSGRLAK
jgi:TetR/AcrR family transcriptional repressor of mexJK operon